MYIVSYLAREKKKNKKNHTEKVKIVKYFLVPQKINKNYAFALIKEKDYPTRFFSFTLPL